MDLSFPARGHSANSKTQLLEVSADNGGWESILKHNSLRSGMLLCQLQDKVVRAAESSLVRRFFLAYGVVLPSCEQRFIRVSTLLVGSMPGGVMNRR
jgi:hypothetical protein